MKRRYRRRICVISHFRVGGENAKYKIVSEKIGRF